MKVLESIQLTEQEEEIFKELVATLQHFGLDTELRVAGGWVRDKVNFLFLAFLFGRLIVCEFGDCLLLKYIEFGKVSIAVARILGGIISPIQ